MCERVPVRISVEGKQKPCPTCEAQRGVFVQGNQRGVQQHCVVILGHDAVIGRLKPRLVLVSCVSKREREKGRLP